MNRTKSYVPPKQQIKAICSFCESADVHVLVSTSRPEKSELYCAKCNKSQLIEDPKVLDVLVKNKDTGGYR